jgi:transposase
VPEQANVSLIASFANDVLKDEVAVSTSMRSPWSNGQADRQIAKLKLVKHQMHETGKLDLLQASVIGTTRSLASPKLRQSLSRAPNVDHSAP